MYNKLIFLYSVANVLCAFSLYCGRASRRNSHSGLCLGPPSHPIQRQDSQERFYNYKKQLKEVLRIRNRMDLHNFEKPDQELHHSERADPDPHQCQKAEPNPDPDMHQS
jgi:hypothetical protein